MARKCKGCGCDPETGERDYMVHVNSGRATFVKERQFFLDQGGGTQPWGKAWKKVRARSIEEARELGAKLLGGRLGP
jgi:hypothetical protein